MIAGGTSLLAVGGLAAFGSSDDGAGEDRAPAGSAPAASAGAGSGTSSGSGPTPLIALDKVPDGGAVAVTAGSLQLIVSRPSGGDPKAFSSVCPHQGCAVAPEGADLKCPCHQSTFSLTGAKISGPSPTGLITYQTAVKDGQVVLTSDTPGAPAV
jgi:nitrite reductase/ring-hydroxylating ferredoxin subunit